jgi:predicted dehydrogenase
MSATRALNIGVISFDHGHQNGYVSELLKLPTGNLVAAADSVPGQLDRMYDMLAAHHDSPEVKVFSDYHELLELDEVEAVSICSANADHAQMTIDAAQAGKHVLCEKPLSITLDEADAMIAACRDAGVYLGTAYPCRFGPVAWQAKQRVDAGEIGEILAMHGTNHLRPFTQGWFIDPERSGGGTIRDHIVHVTDLMRWFTGKEIVEVYAEGDTLKRPHIAVDDAAILVETFEGGILASTDPSWNRPENWSKWGNVYLRLLGTKGMIEFEVTGQALVRTESQSGVVSSIDTSESMNYYLLKDFCEAIIAGRSPMVTGEDGRAGVEAVLAAYQSIEEGRPIRLREG